MDDDFLDACGIDQDEYSTEEEVEMLPLFPDGIADEVKAEIWRTLGDNG